VGHTPSAGVALCLNLRPHAAPRVECPYPQPPLATWVNGMGLLDSLRRLFGGKPEVSAETSFDDTEQEAARQLTEIYGEQRDEELRTALEVLEASMLKAEEIEPEPSPVEFDAGEADADDLLTEDPLVDHYKMAMGDKVDLDSADEHLVEADMVSSDGSDMSAYEQVDVPVGSDDDVEPTTAEMKRMKKAELVELARGRGLTVSGTKADLLERLGD